MRLEVGFRLVFLLVKAEVVPMYKVQFFVSKNSYKLAFCLFILSYSLKVTPMIGTKELV